MHPAHTLAPNHVTMGAGVSSNFVLGDADTRIQNARTVMANGALETPEEKREFVSGAVAYALLAPGLAPWVGARSGVGWSSDAGITYSGRGVRLDGRRSFEDGVLAASVGVGVTGVLVHPGHDQPGEARGGNDEAIPGLDLGGVRGVGAELPLLVGWRSQAELVQVWLGARTGYERLWGSVLLRTDPDPTAEDSAPFEASRWFALGVLGVGVSIHPILIAIELDGGYQKADGSIRLKDNVSGARTRENADLQGLTLTPTAAVIGRLWD